MAVRTEPLSPTPRGAVAKPVMTQDWNNLGFVHWAYPPEVVQQLLPAGLTVDTYGGSAWVGLIGFSMEDIATSGGVSAGPLSSFPEVNVRTYVVDPQGRRNVWFFSLDINRAGPVAVAQTLFGLPYHWGRCSVEAVGDGWEYRVKRRSRQNASTRFLVKPGPMIPEADQTSLEIFLTGRWGMSTVRRNQLFHGSVDHERWPLQRATLVELEDSLVAAAGLPAPEDEPVVHFSTGVSVKIGRLQRVRS